MNILIMVLVLYRMKILKGEVIQRCQNLENDNSNCYRAIFIIKLL